MIVKALFICTITALCSSPLKAQLLSDYAKDLPHPLADFINTNTSELAHAAGLIEPIDNVKLYNSLELNAFVDAQDTLYVTSGLLIHLDSPQAVIAVLAHEISHVKHRHVRNSVIHSNKKARVLSNQSTLSDEDRALKLYLSANRYNQKQEYQADKFAVKLLKRIGYDAKIYKHTLEQLARYESIEGNNAEQPSEEQSTIISSHPDPSARIKALKRLNNKPKTFTISTKDYQKLLSETEIFTLKEPAIKLGDTIFFNNWRNKIELQGNITGVELTVRAGKLHTQEQTFEFELTDSKDHMNLLESLFQSDLIAYELTNLVESKNELFFSANSKITKKSCIEGKLSSLHNKTFSSWTQKKGGCSTSSEWPFQLESITDQELSQVFNLQLIYIDEGAPAPELNTFGSLPDLDTYTNYFTKPGTTKLLR